MQVKLPSWQARAGARVVNEQAQLSNVHVLIVLSLVLVQRFSTGYKQQASSKSVRSQGSFRSVLMLSVEPVFLLSFVCDKTSSE